MVTKILIGVVAACAGAFAWWAFSPLLVDRHVDEALPEYTKQHTQNASENIPETKDTKSGVDVQVQSNNLHTQSSDTEIAYFPITGTSGHPASGSVRVVETPDEKIIRYENYNGTNGPDLKIYLSNDLEARDFVDLGPSRANTGNINYSVPLNVDINDYQYVLTWCEAFGVLFDYAKIN